MLDHHLLPSKTLRLSPEAAELLRLTRRYERALRALERGDWLWCGADPLGIGGFGQLQLPPGRLAPPALASADGRTVQAYYIGHSSYVTLVSNVVSQWASVINGGVNDWTQSTALNRPAYTEQDPTINRRGCVSGDGAATYLAGGVDRPAPVAATPSTHTSTRIVARCNTYVADGRLVGGLCRGGSTSQTLRLMLVGSVSANVAMTDDAWYRVSTLWSDSASDYIRVGPNQATGTVGNSDPGQMLAFAGNGPAGFGDYSIANCLIMSGGDLSAGASRFYDQFARGYYGPNVSVG
jgi:hypothetical protein